MRKEGIEGSLEDETDNCKYISSKNVTYLVYVYTIDCGSAFVSLYAIYIEPREARHSYGIAMSDVPFHKDR